MPTITDETPVTSITIAGQVFEVPQPYKAGDVLNANEASALNQTYAENVRNNFASKVKEAAEAAEKEGEELNLDLLQGKLDDYVVDYEFGVRTGGGRTSDPVMAEALGITRDLVRQALSKAGKKLADYTAAQITEMAKNQLSNTDDPNTVKIMATARARVEASKELTLNIQSDSLDDEAAEEPEEGATEVAAE